MEKQTSWLTLSAVLIAGLVLLSSLFFTVLIRSLPESIGIYLMPPLFLSIILLSAAGLLYGLLNLKRKNTLVSVVFLLSFLSLASIFVQIFLFLM